MLRKGVIGLCFTVCFVFQNVDSQMKRLPPKPPRKPIKVAPLRNVSSESQVQHIPEKSDRKEQSAEQCRKELRDLDEFMLQFENSENQKGVPQQLPPIPTTSLASKQNISNATRQQPTPSMKQQHADFDHQKSVPDIHICLRRFEKQRREINARVRVSGFTQKQEGQSPERPSKSVERLASLGSNTNKSQVRLIPATTAALEEQRTEQLRAEYQQALQELDECVRHLTEFGQELPSAVLISPTQPRPTPRPRQKFTDVEEITSFWENARNQMQMQLRAKNLEEIRKAETENKTEKSAVWDNVGKRDAWEIINNFMEKARQSEISGEKLHTVARRDKFISRDKSSATGITMMQFATPGDPGLTEILPETSENTQSMSRTALNNTMRRQKILDAQKQLYELSSEEKFQETYKNFLRALEIDGTEAQGEKTTKPVISYYYLGRF